MQRWDFQTGIVLNGGVPDESPQGTVFNEDLPSEYRFVAILSLHVVLIE